MYVCNWHINFTWKRPDKAFFDDLVLVWIELQEELWIRIYQTNTDSCICAMKTLGSLSLLGQYSVGYEHRSLENPLGSLENLPARRALVLELLEKNFARFSLGSVCARIMLRSSSLGSIFLCSKCSKCARYGTQNINYSWWIFHSFFWVLLQSSPWPFLLNMTILSTISQTILVCFLLKVFPKVENTHSEGTELNII